MTMPSNKNRLSLFGLLTLVIRRDLLLAMRRRADVLTTLICNLICRQRHCGC